MLRDVIGLTGTKFGRGIAACGACTVHVDGQPIRSCITPASAVAGQRITTIEAIAETVLRMYDAPPIEVHLVPSSEAPGGIGEPGTAATAPALANALYAATGKRIRQLPLQGALIKR